jgi:hypothetical protein
MRAYYNENDKHAAAWLRQLITDGLIADGDVDERSICDVQGRDLHGYGQCHFFAGIGGWSAAFRLAGIPDNFPAWSGSCPCQPFSAAGKRKGVDDARHLWPEFYRLIAECRPAIAFGEQVASKDGRVWLAGVRADLEASRYAVGAADLCAAGIGEPHIRQRLFGWPTPMAGTPAQNGNNAAGNSDFSRKVTDSILAGWPTPKLPSGGAQAVRTTPGGGLRKLEDVADLAGWATPATRDWRDVGDLDKSRARKDGHIRDDTVPRQAFTAATEKRGVLNPALPRWLMGYPVEWCIAAIRASRGMPKGRRKPEQCVCGDTATR